MPDKTRGIVLSTQNYSETSLISRIYTRSFGLQSYIVKGARRKNSKLNPSVFQAPTLVELVAYHRSNRGLQNLSQIECSPAFISIPVNSEKRTLAVFLTDLLYRCIREEECNERLFDFIDNSFQILDGISSYQNFHIQFMVELTKFLGFFPGNSLNGTDLYFDIAEGRFTDHNAETDLVADHKISSLIHEFLKNGMTNSNVIMCTDTEKKKIFDTLIQYYEHHHLHGQKIRSRYLIDDVLN